MNWGIAVGEQPKSWASAGRAAGSAGAGAQALVIMCRHQALSRTAIFPNCSQTGPYIMQKEQGHWESHKPCFECQTGLPSHK